MTRSLRPPKPRVADLLPLTPVVLEVLLALAAGERHGYAILLDVEARTEGRTRLLPGSLYRALHRLREQGLVEEVAGAAEAEDPRRQIFRLTPWGRAVAAAEARRLEAAVATARARRLLPEEERA